MGGRLLRVPNRMWDRLSSRSDDRLESLSHRASSLDALSQVGSAVQAGHLEFGDEAVYEWLEVGAVGGAVAV